MPWDAACAWREAAIADSNYRASKPDNPLVRPTALNPIIVYRQYIMHIDNASHATFSPPATGGRQQECRT
ncbi:MAG: hypothetical protein QOG73_693 [Acetobacteraceae bacterium]|nr:hypothetical protein [Acetobacteraceae bacterium]